MWKNIVRLELRTQERRSKRLRTKIKGYGHFARRLKNKYRYPSVRHDGKTQNVSGDRHSSAHSTTRQAHNVVDELQSSRANTMWEEGGVGNATLESQAPIK